MDYQQAVDYLNAHIRLGGKPGLDRMTELMEFMGNPQRGYPVIHVAGTNGKTSTTRFASSLLLAHGISTGTHSSPHLQRVEERTVVNGEVASPEQFAAAVYDVSVFADLREQRGGVPNTYFELTAATAFAMFAENAVNAAVVEVGMGGRLDATNVVDAEVCVVSSIGLDHIEALGGTLEAIAAEKVAIAGPGSELVSGPLPAPAFTVVSERARELGIHHRRFGLDFGVEDPESGVGGWLATVRGAETVYEDVFLAALGRHQLNNFAIAVASVEALLGDALDPDAVKHAAANTALPGRMERISSNPLVLLDGAHNEEGVGVLVAALTEELPTRRWHLVLAAMKDKQVEQMVAALAPLLNGIVVTSVDSERAWPADQLAEAVVSMVSVPVLVASSVGEALDMARAEAGRDGSVLVTGSLYLVGASRDILAP